MFEKYKKTSLAKLKDAENENKADKKILPLLKIINCSDNYYTTSSCYGRISLLKDQIKKEPGAFIERWHRKIKLSELKKMLGKNYIWFKMEGAILHIGCRDMSSADSLLKYARSIGFKRSGVIEASRRIIVEIASTEKVDAPLNNLLSDSYLKKIVDESNKRFSQNEARVKKLYRFFRK